MADIPQVQPGDDVVYCREDFVGRVDEYQGRVLATGEDGSVDLQVLGYYGTSHTVKGVRFDPDGKPSSWHLAPQGWQPTNVQAGITSSTLGGGQSVQPIEPTVGVKKR